MHGATKTPWTKLVGDLNPNENIIFVEEVNWEIGDKIVIGPSGFNYLEAEEFTITGIEGNLPPFEYVEPPAPEETPPTDGTTGGRILSDSDFSDDELW